MATLNLFGHKYFCKCNSWIRYRSFVLRRYHAVNINKNVHCNGGTFWLNHQKANRFTKNRFSDKPDEQRTVSFIISRGPFGWISNKLKLFLVNSYFDAQFEEEAFLEGAKQVSIYLKQCQFVINIRPEHRVLRYGFAVIRYGWVPSWLSRMWISKQM